MAQSRKDFWYAIAAWAGASSLLMSSPSGFLWSHLPKLAFMQLPWRWLLCLSTGFALAVTIGLRQWWARAVTCVALLLVLAAGWTRVQAPWWDNVADLREIQDNMATGTGYEGTDEYTPIDANHRVIDKDARRVAVEGPAKATIHVLEWNAEAKLFTAELSAPANVAVRLFNYPAWQVEDNGQVVQRSTRGHGTNANTARRRIESRADQFHPHLGSESGRLDFDGRGAEFAAVDFLRTKNREHDQPNRIIERSLPCAPLCPPC